MLRRNWLELSRKLVDQYDLDYTVDAVQAALSEANLSYWGEGVLTTTTYPNPFLITTSSSVLGGTVSPGIAYDPNGQITRIDASNPTSKAFTVATADPTNPRWDLLVISYTQTGDTLIPEPSDPITSVDLNLHDDFVLTVIQGTPSATPSYPTKGSLDIILAGIRVPPGTATGTGLIIDYSVRENSTQGIVHNPVIKQETPSGAIDGTNTIFMLSFAPITSSSVLVLVDGLPQPLANYTISGQTITFSTAPAVGTDIIAYYIVDSSGSTNPLAAKQEVPSGVVDGTNTTFNLTGAPSDQNSTLLFVDGVLSLPTQWSLNQSAGGSSVSFLTAPAAGSDIYCFYFVNAAVLGPGLSSGGGSGSSTSPYTEYPVLTGTDISNGYVTLSKSPTLPSSVLLDIVGGGPCVYETEFTVSGAQLIFQGDLLTGDGSLIAGEQLRIFYFA